MNTRATPPTPRRRRSPASAICRRTTAYAFTNVTVNFSDDVDLISARSPDNYTLVYSPSGVLGAPDNVQILLTPVYSPYPGNGVTLEFTNGVLANGLYQLTVQGVY